MIEELKNITSYHTLKKYIDKYNLRWKKDSNFTIVYSPFDTFPEKRDNINLYKSIIFDNKDYTVVCLSHKRIYYNDYVQISDIEINNTPFDIHETLEGTLVSMYYHNNEWNISTTSYLDAYKCFWKSKKSIGTLFIDTIASVDTEKDTESHWESFCDEHDKNVVYFYTLVHHDNIHLIDYSHRFGDKYKKLCLVFSREKGEMEIKEDKKIQHPCVIYQEEYSDYSILDVWNHEQFYVDHINQIKYKGIVIRNKKNDNIIKLLTKKYNVYNLYNKVKYPGSAEHYISLYQYNLIDKYFEVFSTETYFNNIPVKNIIHKMFRTLTNNIKDLFDLLYDSNNKYTIRQDSKNVYGQLGKVTKKILYLIRGYKKKNINKHTIYYVLKMLSSTEIISIVNERYKYFENDDKEDSNNILSSISNDVIISYLIDNSHDISI